LGEIVNLKQVRKRKARAEDEAAAHANRVKHGTPKHLRKIAKTEEARAAQEIEGHRLDRDEES
jgi:hypothetical protein